MKLVMYEIVNTEKGFVIKKNNILVSLEEKKPLLFETYEKAKSYITNTFQAKWNICQAVPE